MSDGAESAGHAAGEHRASFAVHMMTPGVVQIPGDVSVGEAARLMQKERVPCLLIKDTDATTGIMTHEDIVCKVVARGLDPYEVQARLVMSIPVQFIEFDQPAERVTSAMASAGVPLLIVTRDHHPIGFITARDLIQAPKRHELPIQASITLYQERPEGTAYPAVIRHLSHVGAFVETAAPMQPGARVRAEFSLPGSKRVIAAEAKILEPPAEHELHSRHRPPGSGAAIQFTALPLDDHSEISAWLQRTRWPTAGPS